MWGRVLCLILLLGFAVGCRKSTSSGTASRCGATCAGPTPVSYCETSYAYPAGTYPNAATISGTAQYHTRPWTGSGLGSAAASLDPENTFPIRFAEVRVTNSSGSLVACTNTSASGTFSIQVPTSSETYKVSVNSRVKRGTEEINVLDAPETNRFYSLQSTVTPSQSTSTALSATVESSGPVLGAAFNILDKIVLANEFLQAKTANCDSTFTGCVPFEMTHKLDAFWTKGFNPNAYFGSSTEGLSFYLPGYYRLFILGGINGGLDGLSDDTDHFDNSVIVHEYAHFLEDTAFRSDSPGGSHSGNKVIDPRLAWSEGWSNFFQGAVLTWKPAGSGIQYPIQCPNALSPCVPRYQDTLGNADGEPNFYFDVNLEENSPPDRDKPVYQGEGNFREFSVARALIDANDTTNESGDSVSDNFMTLWAALTKSTDFGLRNSKSAFRSLGQVHKAQRDLQANHGASDWSGIRTVEKQDGDMSQYAQYVTPGTCSAFTITPASISLDSGLFSTSDLLRNNDFYHLKIAASGTYTITLEYSDANGNFYEDGLTDSSTGLPKEDPEVNLDLYLYNSSARFGNSSDWVKYTVNDPDGKPSTPESESFTVSLAPGDYLINTYVRTKKKPLGRAVQYSLKMGDSTLCPTDLPN